MLVVDLVDKDIHTIRGLLHTRDFVLVYLITVRQQVRVTVTVVLVFGVGMVDKIVLEVIVDARLVMFVLVVAGVALDIVLIFQDVARQLMVDGARGVIIVVLNVDSL